MALSPTSSRGTTFNGGTITNPLTVETGLVGNAVGVKVEGHNGEIIDLLDIDTNAEVALGAYAGQAQVFARSTTSENDDFLSFVDNANARRFSVYRSGRLELKPTAADNPLDVFNASGTYVGGWVAAGYLSTEVHSAPATGAMDTGALMFWFDQTNGAASLNLKAKQANGAVVTGSVTLALPASGALPVTTLTSGVGAQLLTSRDVESVTPVTFNPGAATTATCTVELSPDNVTYSTLGVETEPAGVAFDGTIHLVKVRVPAGWYLRLTVNAQAVLGNTTYY